MIRTSESVSLGWKAVVVFALAVLAFSIAPASARSHAEDGVNGYAVTALVSSHAMPGTGVDTDLWNGNVDVFDASWAAVTTPGGFMDRKIPAGYAPFGIQTIGDRIFVTFAKQGPTGDELHGQGFGFVDAFDWAGNLLVHVARHGSLNAPWGLALAPANFGRFGGDLLVGNFGDGKIIAYAE